ncbi:hypothetical protein GCK72_024647 [Caenorhabditis remanei]|uniref:Autophagy-related protein 2 n=1 Tax=Caenorhabditis remanei TaxID=31234 RepID=A0A6A5FZV3_CAERE|nr:hypothetical protein GCK72_024647 [Caenorhabditis remanei]KAF1748180.1 hypothetical protein GCK72_024647 [Caenorhabditis remanei]
MTLHTINRVWCKIMIQRYLGVWLDNNLSFDQLSIELSNGSLELECLDINTRAVSAALAAGSIPLKLVDGYVGKIRIEIPWVRIMTDPTRMSIEDLQLTFRGADVVKLDDMETITSMIESVLMSLSTDDMARSVFDEVSKENTITMDFKGNEETADSFSGIINAVWSRFCLTVHNLTLRFENEPKNKSEMATAVEIHVQKITFMDEQMRSCEMDHTNATDLVTTQPHGVGSTTNLNKNLTFHGVSIHTDVFSEIANEGNEDEILITSMHIRREKAKQMSPTKSVYNSSHPDMFQSAMSDMDAFHSCYDKLTQESTSPDQLETLRTAPAEPELFSNPIKCGEVIGDISCVFRIKNAANDVNVADIEESKIETDIFVKGLNLFATASQIEIMKRYFLSITTPKGIIVQEQGKPMSKEDYENMTKNMEPNQTPEAPISVPTFGGNWNAGEEFKEFENAKSLKQKEKEKSEKEKFKTLKANSNVKEEFTVRTHIGTLLAYIPHCDYMSSDYARQHGGYGKVLEALQKESKQFFNGIQGFSFLSKHGLANIRQAAEAFYPKDHLRVIGGSLAVTSSSSRIGTVDTFSCRINATHFDMLEYLTPESAPGHNGPLTVNILDYSNQENVECDPNFKMVLRTSSEKKGETKIDVLLGAVRSELDFSIIDRISNLIICKPFFDDESEKGAQRNKVPQLKDDLYAEANATEDDAKSKTLFNLVCPNWQVDLRIPKADLRDPTGSRLPFSQRHVHNEYLSLGIKEIDVSIPIGKDVSFIEILCSEMFGDFCGEGLNIPKEQQRVLYASKNGFDKINLKLALNGNTKIPGRDSTSSSIPESMLKSVSADIMMAHPKKEGPFSKVPRSYMSHDGEEKEEIIQAGTRREILSFQKDCEDFASTFMLFTIPVLKLHIPEKSFLEILYNRLVNDLALFQPAAPAFRAEADAVTNAQPVESFQECVSPKNYAESEHSESDDDALTLKESVDSIDFDRDVPHTFVMTLNAKKCAILCNTSIKEDEKAPEAAQVSLDLEKVHIGTTAGYHGDINHTYFHFTSSKAAVGSVDALKGVQIPNVISAKDFGKWNKDLNQLEYVLATDELSSGSTEDAFAVALHMNFKPDVNVKDVLVGIAIRNSQLQAKPFKNWGAFWITQLSELFTLQDYAIPGYVLPTVSTDLHICLENAIIGYDHSWINPSSKLKLRAALGHCNLASSIVSDMNISKTLCIFESCRLYMSHDSLKDAVRFEGYGAPKAPTKKFIPFLDFGSVQLDILFAVGEETGSRTTPAFEIRCQNDIINAWACADSLATFIQTVMEYTSHGQVPVKTPAEEETDELEKSIKNEDIAKSVAGESVWSDASTGSKHIQKMGVGAALPDDVEKRLQAMIREAVDENDESAGIAIGEDAVKEFTMTKPKPKKPSRKPSKNMEDPTRNYTITDEEFCMVDDNVFGSGITNLPGESRVRSMTAKNKYDEPPLTKQDFFHSIEESGNDGLYQTMSGNWTPALRYFLKDVTLRLSLYAGNDLSTTPSPIRTYCTEEYRNGYGPEQKIEKNSAGGPNRDHSAFVVLELNRITYLKQVFEKNAPLLSTSLFQIGDVVIKDCVKASTIQEMLYQYSVVNQPRRGSAPIFSVRIAESQSKEGKMRVSMLPIKINVDQDTMEFLIEFFEETSRLLDLPKNQMNPLIQRPVIEVPAEPSSRKTSPKTSVSSSEGDVAPRMYPSIPEPAMTLEPLQPSPVQPATPLGDLSYLEKISSNHQSPVKRPIIDAPLTASAVSIGRIFESPKNEVDDEPVDPIQIEEMGNFNINEELRRINELGKSKSSPLFNDSESESSDEEDETNTDFVVPHTSQHQKLHESFDHAHPADLSDLAGDWADDDDSIDHFTAHTENDHYHNSKTTKCEELQTLNLMDEEESGKGSMTSPMPSSPLRSTRSVKRELPPLKMPQQPLSNDDILLRSTMMGSIHPTQSVHNLVDTSDDLEEHSNFLDGLDDDEDEEKQNVEEEMEEEQKKEEEERDKEIQEAVERGETFFKQFVFSPSVNIYVDYQGKRKITMEKQGAIVGLLMAFGQLNQMPITLKKINTRTGLLGSGRCMQHAIGEWSGDMLTNMPSVIASYGPISPLVQIGRGVVDLFWMPVSEFRKNDGNVMKGVQRGVGSFSVSSAAGIVGMAQTVTGFVQSLAEMTMNEIKPDDPSTRRSRRYNRHHGTNPTDVRHSLQLAYGILYDGYHQTRDDLELAAQEDRASGNSVVRSAFRYAVPTFLGPIVMATQVTYQLLGGLRNQLRPDTYQDERRKWGEKDVPGGVNK